MKDFDEDDVTMGELKAQTNEAAYVGFKIVVAGGNDKTTPFFWKGVVNF